jgi:hypothetical protein
LTSVKTDEVNPDIVTTVQVTDSSVFTLVVKYSYNIPDDNLHMLSPDYLEGLMDKRLDGHLKTYNQRLNVIETSMVKISEDPPDNQVRAYADYRLGYYFWNLSSVLVSPTFVL